MKTPTSNFRLIAVLAVASCAIAPACAGGLTRDGKVRMPDLSGITNNGTVIVGLSMNFDCVGVASIEGLPDQWNAALSVRGENNTLVLSPYDSQGLLAADAQERRRQTNQALKDIRIDLHWRGEWSDCAGWELHAEGMRPTADGSWTIVRQSFSGGLGLKWNAGAVTGVAP